MEYATATPAILFSTEERHTGDMTTGQVWSQRSNGSWKNMKNESPTPAVINSIRPFGQRAAAAS